MTLIALKAVSLRRASSMAIFSSLFLNFKCLVVFFLLVYQGPRWLLVVAVVNVAAVAIRM